FSTTTSSPVRGSRLTKRLMSQLRAPVTIRSNGKLNLPSQLDRSTLYLRKIEIGFLVLQCSRYDRSDSHLSDWTGISVCSNHLQHPRGFDPFQCPLSEDRMGADHKNAIRASLLAGFRGLCVSAACADDVVGEDHVSSFQ